MKILRQKKRRILSRNYNILVLIGTIRNFYSSITRSELPCGLCRRVVHKEYNNCPLWKRGTKGDFMEINFIKKSPLSPGLPKRGI
jgi:hypothetical protein